MKIRIFGILCAVEFDGNTDWKVVTGGGDEDFGFDAKKWQVHVKLPDKKERELARLVIDQVLRQEVIIFDREGNLLTVPGQRAPTK